MCLPEEYHSPLCPGQELDLWGSCPLQGFEWELARLPQSNILDFLTVNFFVIQRVCLDPRRFRRFRRFSA
jgi:hypothetical protein